MITAAIHGVTVSPRARQSGGESDALSRIASEISVRVIEMNEIGTGKGSDFVMRLASVGRLDRGSLEIALAVLHGDTSKLTDSYSERGDSVGRKKQTIHYRTIQHIENIKAVFPELAEMLDQIRLSVKHHEDPISKGQTIRDAME